MATKYPKKLELPALKQKNSTLATQTKIVTDFYKDTFDLLGLTKFNITTSTTTFSTGTETFFRFLFDYE